MKFATALAAFTSVFLVVSAVFGGACAQLQVSTHDVGDKAQTTPMGKSVFAVDSTSSIEFEQQSGWLPGKTYIVNWTLRLDYVNPEFLNGSFFIRFGWPTQDRVMSKIPHVVVLNETDLSLNHKTGILSAAFTPTNDSEGFFMNPEFPYAVYVNGSVPAMVCSKGIWYGDGATTTNVPSSFPTAQPTALNPEITPDFTLPTIIVATGVLAAGSGFVLTRKRKT